MTGFFSNEIVAQLRAPLSREHIKTRPGAGKKLSYLEAWYVIDEANRIFGFDGWNREMIECKCVAERETKIGPPFDDQGNPLQQKDGWRVGYVARIRITVGPVVREGTGYGSGIDVDLGAAHESAIKETESDAMKRALVTFGNPFGLALYDRAQANVEAPTRPPVVARPAATLLHHPIDDEPRAHSSTGDGHRPSKLSEVRDAILHALEVADSPSRIDGILRVHEKNLAEIRVASIPTYDRLMRIAGECRGKLVEPPRPAFPVAGSAPELMGEP